MSENKAFSLPPVVSEAEWREAHDAFLVKEKAATHARDALAAERRRLPAVKINQNYVFEGLSQDARKPSTGTAPTGVTAASSLNVKPVPVSLLDLFEGRRQLLLYHFMFAPGVHGWPNAGCPGCSMFTDNIGQFAPAHLKARDISLALVSRGPLANLEAYRQRMQWPHRWVSSANNTFNADLQITTPEGENHGLSVLVREGTDIYRTYFTSRRGTEGLGNVWGFLDSTPYGRQEKWEDSPAGWPQSPPYQWWRRHDEY